MIRMTNLTCKHCGREIRLSQYIYLYHGKEEYYHSISLDEFERIARLRFDITPPRDPSFIKTDMLALFELLDGRLTDCPNPIPETDKERMIRLSAEEGL